jgi:hypothetical protein
MTVASALVQAPVPAGALDRGDVEMEPSPPHAGSLVPIQQKDKFCKMVWRGGEDRKYKKQNELTKGNKRNWSNKCKRK